jgi:predicted nucleic acid-binding protein
LNDYVIDASALVLALAGKTASARTLRGRLSDMRRHAPHLIDAEVGNVLRRQERAGRISTGEADTALRVAAALVHYRYPHTGPLARRAWNLRHNFSFYDGLYIALASYLDVPLLTADARLSKAPGLTCQTELV